MSVWILLATLLVSHPVINEVSWGDLQWVEIYNPGPDPVVLDQWAIGNAYDWDPLYGTIPPGGYLLVVPDEAQFRQYFPELEVPMVEMPDGTIGSGLRANDLLILVDAQGVPVDLVNWGTPDPNWPNYRVDLWEPGVTNQREVIGRLPNGQDTDSPLDWRPLRVATPGTENRLAAGLTPSSWGKIKALFSEKRRRL